MHGAVVRWALACLHLLILIQCDNTQGVSFQKGSCKTSNIRGTFNLRAASVKELRDAREKRLGVVTLKQAKQQLIGQIGLGADSGSGWMSTMGKSIMLYDRVRPLEEAFHAIDSVSADDVLEVANEILDPNRLSTLVYFPPKG